MGTGKSVIGKKVADLLGYGFLDSDLWIETHEGKGIPQIFEEKGEAYFRSLEQEFLERGHPASGHVISCGGGLIIPEGRLELVKSMGILFCLFATPETIYERTKTNRNRPLLKGEEPVDRIRQLLAEREPVYLRAGTLITTDNRPLAEVAGQIKRSYLEQCSSQRDRS